MKHKLKRIAASVLTLALLAVPALAAAENVGSSTLNVANNTVYTYSTQAVTSDSGKQTNLHENIFTYKKEAQVRPVVAFGTTLYGTSPMNKTIKTLEEQGYSMVAGINGSFFDRSTGIPYGIVVTNSILRSGGSANAVGFLADGSALIGDPVVAVTLDYGADTPLLLNYNKAMTTQNGVLLYSQDYDTRTKNTIEGYHVIVRPVGSRAAELRLGQTLTVEVVGMVRPLELPASSQVYRMSEPSRVTPMAVRAAIFFAESSVKSVQTCPFSTSMSAARRRRASPIPATPPARRRTCRPTASCANARISSFSSARSRMRGPPRSCICIPSAATRCPARSSP